MLTAVCASSYHSDVYIHKMVKKSPCKMDYSRFPTHPLRPWQHPCRPTRCKAFLLFFAHVSRGYKHRSLPRLVRRSLQSAPATWRLLKRESDGGLLRCRCLVSDWMILSQSVSRASHTRTIVPSDRAYLSRLSFWKIIRAQPSTGSADLCSDYLDYS